MKVVYKHINSYGIIFYIGNGTLERAYSKFNRTKTWKENALMKYTVEIVKDNLTIKEANDLETKLIAFYGRKDLSQGFLCNQTDGGFGSNNHIVSIETKMKMRKPKTKYTRLNNNSLRKTYKSRTKQPRSKQIINIETNEIYENITVLANILNIKRTTLSYNLKTKNERYKVYNYI